MAFDRDKIEQGVRLILEGIGEEPDRGGLKETPSRVGRMYEEICAGIEGVWPANYNCPGQIVVSGEEDRSSPWSTGPTSTR